MAISLDVTFKEYKRYSSRKIPAVMKKLRRNLHNLLQKKPSQRTSNGAKCEDFESKRISPTIPRGGIFNSGDEDGDVLMDLDFQNRSKNQGLTEEKRHNLCYFQKPLGHDITTLQKILGLRDQKYKRDVVFISLALKTSKTNMEELEEGSATIHAGSLGKVTEFAISTLDTRDLFKATSRNEQIGHLIKTDYYIIDDFSTGRPQPHVEEQKCGFADAKHITARRARFTLSKAFKIRDEFGIICDGRSRYRDVVFVGCSPQFERQILIDNGIVMWNGGRMMYKFDLLPLTRWLYGHSEYLDKLPLMERFSLDAVLGELLGCEEKMGNAGDMAAYTLLAMLQLAINSNRPRYKIQAGPVMANIALMELARNESRQRKPETTILP